MVCAGRLWFFFIIVVSVTSLAPKCVGPTVAVTYLCSRIRPGADFRPCAAGSAVLFIIFFILSFSPVAPTGEATKRG